MQRGNVGGNLFSLIRSRIWLPISFALQTLGAYSHLFSWKFHLLPQYKTPRKSRCKKISINARKENHVPFSSSFRKSVEPKVGEELSTWRLHSVLQLLQQRQNEKAVKQELYYHSWKIIDHVMRSRNSKKLLCPIFTVWQKTLLFCPGSFENMISSSANESLIDALIS